MKIQIQIWNQWLVVVFVKKYGVLPERNEQDQRWNEFQQDEASLLQNKTNLFQAEFG